MSGIALLQFVARRFPAVVLSGDQVQALTQIGDWLDRPRRKDFVLSGYAGTGKTFIVKLINAYIHEMGMEAVNVSYTGKAADVLRGHDLAFPASTIHSAIYKPMEIWKNGKKGVEWRRIKEREFTPHFVVADEASMIGKELYKDLVFFKKPILFIGDGFQLEPIETGDFSIMKHPDITMTEIVRQAQGSPIIGMSSLLRHRQVIPKLNVPGFYHGPITPEVEALLHSAKYDRELQIVVAYNNDRRLLNDKINGEPCKAFEPGDRIINLENNQALNIYNGQQGIIEDVHAFDDDTGMYDLTVRFFGSDTAVRVPAFDTDGLVSMSSDEDQRDSAVKLAYSYAVTVHKAQGSQWDKVIVMVPRWRHPEWNFWRWCYTAITRAAKQCWVIQMD